MYRERTHARGAGRSVFGGSPITRRVRYPCRLRWGACFKEQYEQQLAEARHRAAATTSATSEAPVAPPVMSHEPERIQ